MVVLMHPPYGKLNYDFVMCQSHLTGAVRISGSKNNAIRLLISTLLTDDVVVLHDIPTTLIDVMITLDMLEQLGKVIEVIDGETMAIYGAKNDDSYSVTLNSHSIRTTILVFHILLGRIGKAIVPLPGGCRLGSRPFDLHEIIWRRMGAEVWFEDGYIHGLAPKGLNGIDIDLPITSNGATETAIMGGSIATGYTTIRGVQLTPELSNMIALLRRMGANISTSEHVIKVHGVSELHGAEHANIPDAAEAITYIIAAAVTKGDIIIHDVPTTGLSNILYKLEKIGIRIQLIKHRTIRITGKAINPFSICAGPYPAIYSDMQPLFSVLGLLGNGKSTIADHRWPTRFQYVKELQRLGANMKLTGGKLHVFGVSIPSGGNCQALDIRCGASLLLAGLIAKHTTVISNAWQIDRGYTSIVDKLGKLNADITLREHKLSN